MGKENKSTAAQFEKRVNDVYKLILKGAGRGDIIQYVLDSDEKYEKSDKPEDRAKIWNVSESQIDHYIAKATERFKEYAAKQREDMFSKSLARLEFVYQSCIRVQDYSKAIAAVRELNLLMGLHEPAKSSQEHSGQIEILIRRTHANPDETTHD